MISHPLVTVLMACYNSDPNALKYAILSVLGQVFNDFELIIVDDGSNYSIEDFVHSITNDKRVTVYKIHHSGLGAALNHGATFSKGQYIARFDDDDIMCTRRLESQVNYMQNHPECSCVGCMHYDKVGNKVLKHRRYPINHDSIIKSLLSLKWAMAHTTVMFRKDAFINIGGYRINGGGQDLDLFLQLGTVGCLANINEYLVYYTMSSSGLSQVNPHKYNAYMYAINDVLERDLFPKYKNITTETLARLALINNKQSKRKISFARQILIWRIIIFGKNYE